MSRIIHMLTQYDFNDKLTSNFVSLSGTYVYIVRTHDQPHIICKIKNENFLKLVW